MPAGMMDIDLTSLSNRLNETMKVLTVIATIFIPLTFIVGIYGMNFEVMPELEWPWSYPLVMGLMLVPAIGMLWVFRRKHWIYGPGAGLLYPNGLGKDMNHNHAGDDQSHPNDCRRVWNFPKGDCTYERQENDADPRPNRIGNADRHTSQHET